MRRWILLLALVPIGCEAFQLRDNTLRQASTLTDLQYTQVLDNLAMLATDPNGMPWYSLARTGVTTIQQTGTVNGSLNWDYLAGANPGSYLNRLDRKQLGLMASQQDIEQWNTESVLNPDKLALMRCLYQRVLGVECGDPECDRVLATFFRNKPQVLAGLHPGWYGIGGRTDVPKHACYVGHSCHTYVWVLPEGQHDLANLALAILDIATVATDLSVDPRIAQIKTEEDRLKTLVDVYHDLPDTTEEEKAARLLLLKRIEGELAKLEILYGPLPPGQKRQEYRTRLEQIYQTGKAATPPKGILPSAWPALQAQLKAQREAALKTFDAALEAPAYEAPFRPRERTTLFPQIPNVVPAP